MRLGGRLLSGGNEACVKEVAEPERVWVPPMMQQLVFLCLAAGQHSLPVLAWVLSDLTMPESGNRYPTCYIHKSVNLNLI